MLPLFFYVHVLQLLVPDASFQISVLGHLWSNHQNSLFLFLLITCLFLFALLSRHKKMRFLYHIILSSLFFFFFSHSYYPMLLAHGSVWNWLLLDHHRVHLTIVDLFFMRRCTYVCSPLHPGSPQSVGVGVLRFWSVIPYLAFWLAWVPCYLCCYYDNITQSCAWHSKFLVLA